MLFVGNCEKYDVVVSVASLVKTITKGDVAIVTDSDHSYKYFDGEVSGVQILKTVPTNFNGVIIYDCYQVIVPDSLEGMKVVLFTTLDRPTYEYSVSLSQRIKTDVLISLYEDCIIDEKSIDLNFGIIEQKFEIENQPGRRIDMLHEERINYKKLDKAFRGVVDELVAMILDKDVKEVKKYWEALDKSGYGGLLRKKGILG